MSGFLLMQLGSTAFAHHLPPGIAEIDEFFDSASFLAGFNHPLIGFDHLIAALIAGICASRAGKWASWILVGAGAALMAGCGFGFSGLRLPEGELIVAATVVASATFMVGFSSGRVWPAAAITAACQLWHGDLHALEMPRGTGAGAHAFGAVSATLLCMVCGWALATLFLRRTLQTSRRVIHSH